MLETNLGKRLILCLDTSLSLHWNEQKDKLDLHQLLNSMTEIGVESVMCAYVEPFLQALKNSPAALNILPIIPNTSLYSRDVSDLGTLGALKKRVREAKLGEKINLTLWGIKNVKRVLAKEFVAGLEIMLQLELAAFSRYRPKKIFLHSQITDLALACENHTLFFVFWDVIQRKYKAEAGLETYNFGHLIPFLEKHKIPIRLIATPVNPLGFKMNPTALVCQRILKEDRYEVIAKEVTAQDAVSVEETLAFFQDYPSLKLALRPTERNDIQKTWQRLLS